MTIGRCSSHLGSVGGGSIGVLLVVMLGSLGALLLRGVGCGVRVWGVRIFGWGFRAGSLVCFVS